MRLPLIPPLAQTEDEVVRGPLPKNLAVTTYGETSYGGVRPAAVEVATFAGTGKGMTGFNDSLLLISGTTMTDFAEVETATPPSPLRTYTETFSGDFFDFVQSTL